MKTYSVPRQIWRVVNMPLIYVLVQVVVTFLATLIYGINYGLKQASSGNTVIDQSELAMAAEDFMNNNIMLIMLVSSCICFTIFFLVWNKERKVLDKNVNGLSLVNIVSIMILGVSTNVVISMILGLTGIVEYFPSYDVVEKAVTSGGLLIRILTVGILAPAVEELCFRGLIFNRLRKSLSLIASIIISSVLFGIIHLNLLQGIYATIIGIVFVVIYVKFKTIWAPIIFHVAFNMFSVLISDISEESTSSTYDIIIFIVGVLVTVLIAWFVSKQKVVISLPKDETIVNQEEK